MHVYKFSFLKNEVLSVTKAEPDSRFDGNVFYEMANGQLIFAIIKAETEDAARGIVKEIIDSTDSTRA